MTWLPLDARCRQVLANIMRNEFGARRRGSKRNQILKFIRKVFGAAPKETAAPTLVAA